MNTKETEVVVKRYPYAKCKNCNRRKGCKRGRNIKDDKDFLSRFAKGDKSVYDREVDE